MLELDGAQAPAAVGGAVATAKPDGETALQPPRKGEDGERPTSVKQPPLTMTVAGMDSSCSSLLVSPPPPMRVFSSGGQSSAYAALKSLNADDDLGHSGAHLVRRDTRGTEGVVGSSPRYFAVPAHSQGMSSLPPQPTVERNPAAVEGPPSLTSNMVTSEVHSV